MDLVVAQRIDELQGVVGHLRHGIGDLRERTARRAAMIMHDHGEMFGEPVDVCVPKTAVTAQSWDQEQGRSGPSTFVVELGPVAELDVWHRIPFRRYVTWEESAR